MMNLILDLIAEYVYRVDILLPGPTLLALGAPLELRDASRPLSRRGTGSFVLKKCLMR